MNLRPLILRAAVVVALFGVAFLTAALSPRSNPDTQFKSNQSIPLVLLPLVALPVLHALLAP